MKSHGPDLIFVLRNLNKEIGTNTEQPGHVEQNQLSDQNPGAWMLEFHKIKKTQRRSSFLNFCFLRYPGVSLYI